MIRCPSIVTHSSQFRFHIFSAEKVAVEAAHSLAKILTDSLSQNKSVLLLLSGGSAIKMYGYIFQFLETGTHLQHLNLGLADERFGPFGHPDSNEQQLRDAGVIKAFEDRGAHFFGMLTQDHLNEKETAKRAATIYRRLFEEADTIILSAGIGEDGHTLGWLPTQTRKEFMHLYDSPADVTFYTLDPRNSPNPFRSRLTLTLTAAKKAHRMFVFAQGKNKRMALQKLTQEVGPVHTIPARALFQSLHPLEIWTDQVVTGKKIKNVVPTPSSDLNEILP